MKNHFHDLVTTYPEMLTQHRYRWLEKLEFKPRMIIEFLKIYGTKEYLGKKNNPVILEWAKELGIDNIYTQDEIPWCGLAMGVIAKRSNKELPRGLLWAMNWIRFGTYVDIDDACLGDVIGFSRKPYGGHVGLYIAESESTFHIGGGNQGDMVNIAELKKTRAVFCRRPVYKVGKPSSVKKYFMDSTGKLSFNEA